MSVSKGEVIYKVQTDWVPDYSKRSNECSVSTIINKFRSLNKSKSVKNVNQISILYAKKIFSPPKQVLKEKDKCFKRFKSGNCEECGLEPCHRAEWIQK